MMPLYHIPVGMPTVYGGVMRVEAQRARAGGGGQQGRLMPLPWLRRLPPAESSPESIRWRLGVAGARRADRTCIIIAQDQSQHD